MNLVERAKSICLTPGTEWPVIASETTSTNDLVTGYVIPLAAIGSIAGFIGGSLIGYSLPFVGSYRVPLFAGLGMAIFTFVMAIVSIFVISFIINALAPTFSATQNSSAAFKLAVYSYTPAWIAGVFRLFPMLSLLVLLASLYSLYLLYLGLPKLMKCPEDKAVGYTVVVVICAIVLSVVVTAVGGVFIGAGMMSSGLLGGGIRGTRSPSAVTFDSGSPMGKLQQLSEKLEQSNKKMEAAQKSGDGAAQAAAAMESLGTLLGGGTRVEPISTEQLKPFVPDTFAGLPKKSSNIERTGLAGLMVAKAEATYDDGAARHVQLELSDSGGVSGLMALAGWAGIQGEKEDDSSAERTAKIDGRLVHEKRSKQGGSNEYDLILGDRFLVKAEGRGVDLATLKTAVAGLDLAKLEAMKSVGVQK